MGNGSNNMYRGLMGILILVLLLSPSISSAQQSGQVRAGMSVPQTTKPELDKAVSGKDCPDGFDKVIRGGVKTCVKCRNDFIYHDYYGQGLCIACPDGARLAEFGGKVMCFTCPSGYRLPRPRGFSNGVPLFQRHPICQRK